jgi:signal transduction histidine kinase
MAHETSAAPARSIEGHIPTMRPAHPGLLPMTAPTVGSPMRLSDFIEQNREAIVVEWEAFARATIAPAKAMSTLALRDHAMQILLAIAKDMRSNQTEVERYVKSRGLAETTDAASETSATTHGILRHLVGFDLVQLAAEYRAVRATVLRLWTRELATADATALEDVARFNEGIDQALAESIASYSDGVANSRDTFLAILGHDLRSPLSTIASSLYVLRNGPPDEAQRLRTLQLLQRSVSSMRRMITDLLEYTRTRLGRGIEVVPVAGDFSVLCREALEEIEAAHPDRSFESRLPDQLTARFDAARMRQVLINLLSNAVQHGDPDAPIALALSSEGKEVCCEVRNRGTPIPPDALPTIFDPLVQASPGVADGGPAGRNVSLGLGLFIAREIVTAHGGTIGATSSGEDGTAFTLRMPTSALQQDR